MSLHLSDACCHRSHCGPRYTTGFCTCAGLFSRASLIPPPQRPVVFGAYSLTARLYLKRVLLRPHCALVLSRGGGSKAPPSPVFGGRGATLQISTRAPLCYMSVCDARSSQSPWAKPERTLGKDLPHWESLAPSAHCALDVARSPSCGNSGSQG